MPYRRYHIKSQGETPNRACLGVRHDHSNAMRVMVAMSGGVDSSVAAYLLKQAGHEVVGVTLRLWGGDTDTGCCSVSDVDDARRAAQIAGVEHIVFNFAEAFDAGVVQNYVDGHRRGLTPNPCVECNRTIKFEKLYLRAQTLGFDAIATGHHAQTEFDGSTWRLKRGADEAKDQSYVLHMIPQERLGSILFPIGHLSKTQVREIARDAGIKTAEKRDSQDVCFIGRNKGQARANFLRERIPLTTGEIKTETGETIGEIQGTELVTIGQRKGLSLGGGKEGLYVTAVRPREVIVGPRESLETRETLVSNFTWTGPQRPSEALVQTSAHGDVAAASVITEDGAVRLVWETKRIRVASGQSVVLYDPTNTYVLGGGTAYERA